MAVSYRSIGSFFEAKSGFNQLGIRLKKLMDMMKNKEKTVIDFKSHISQKENFAKILGYSQIDKQYKELIKSSLIAIAKYDKEKAKKLWERLRLILTAPTINPEKQEDKIFIVLSQVAIYLRKKEPGLVDNLLARLAKIATTSKQGNGELELSAKSSTRSNKNFPRFDLERRINTFLIEFAAQNTVWSRTSDDILEARVSKAAVKQQALTFGLHNYLAAHKSHVSEPSTSFSQTVIEKPAVEDDIKYLSKFNRL